MNAITMGVAIAFQRAGLYRLADNFPESTATAMSKQKSQPYLSTYVLIFAAICLTGTGCDLRPNWGSPGPIGTQRTRAVLHDPFPSKDLAPPIVGARPPGFEQPQSEATSLQSSPFAKRTAAGSPYTPAYGF